MKAITTIKYLLALTLISLVAACGSSSTDTRILDTTDSYTVEYIPGATDATQGKTTFQIKVTNKTTGAAVTGAAVTINPMMAMLSGMNHSTPVEAVTDDNNDGTYDAVAYYLMPTSDMTGT
ncbi:MAG: FixH family protein, partial [Gammaproteobacteria bacterium]|nr:FixH family protein [Gammaproteobacteria bacterium]